MQEKRNMTQKNIKLLVNIVVGNSRIVDQGLATPTFCCGPVVGDSRTIDQGVGTIRPSA